MVDSRSIKQVFSHISSLMTENKAYLGALDAQNGDGDLGVSMDRGFQAVSKYLQSADVQDLGRLFMQCSRVFNDNAPSSLGTILSLILMGMAKPLKGSQTASVEDLITAMESGIRLCMEKAGSHPGEKTILDSLCPALESLKTHVGAPAKLRFELAAAAAAEGSEATRSMRSVHGRAAYYGSKSIGLLDGGSVVGKLIFEGISRSVSQSASNR